MQGCKMYIFCKKLKALKPVLRSLNRSQFNDTQRRIASTRADLLSIQHSFLSQPTVDLASKVGATSKLLSSLLLAEKSPLQ